MQNKTKLEVNREPLVRRGYPENKVSNKIASVGYIKFKIVDQAVGKQRSVGMLNSSSNIPYSKLPENEHKLEIAWHDFEEDILAKLQGIGYL